MKYQVHGRVEYATTKNRQEKNKYRYKNIVTELRRHHFYKQNTCKTKSPFCYADEESAVRWHRIADDVSSGMFHFEMTANNQHV